MKIKTIEMDTDKFIKIQANPIQRDTRVHAKTASKKHLAVDAVTHCKVSIAKAGAIQWKLDGHTRAYLWKEGELKAPSLLSVDVYDVKDKAEAIALYRHFDNKNATESNQDQITGALRYMGITNYDPAFARNCGMYSACQLINIACKRFDPRQSVLDTLIPYKKEIKMLINQFWSKTTTGGKPGIPGCTVAAFLITTKMYREDCLGFWDGYYTGEGGETLKSGRDGSKAAADYIKAARKDDRIMGRHNSAACTEALLTAYQVYRSRKGVGRVSSLYKRIHNMSTMTQLGQYLTEIGYS